MEVSTYTYQLFSLADNTVLKTHISEAAGPEPCWVTTPHTILKANFRVEEKRAGSCQMLLWVPLMLW